MAKTKLTNTSVHRNATVAVPINSVAPNNSEVVASAEPYVDQVVNYPRAEDNEGEHDERESNEISSTDISFDEPTTTDSKEVRASIKNGTLKEPEDQPDYSETSSLTGAASVLGFSLAKKSTKKHDPVKTKNSDQDTPSAVLAEEPGSLPVPGTKTIVESKTEAEESNLVEDHGIVPIHGVSTGKTGSSTNRQGYDKDDSPRHDENRPSSVKRQTNAIKDIKELDTDSHIRGQSGKEKGQEEDAKKLESRNDNEADIDETEHDSVVAVKKIKKKTKIPSKPKTTSSASVSSKSSSAMPSIKVSTKQKEVPLLAAEHKSDIGTGPINSSQKKKKKKKGFLRKLLCRSRIARTE